MDRGLQGFIKKVLVALHINISDEKIAGLIQFVKFGIVGISNTIISYVLNILVLFLMRPLKLSWDFIIGNIVAFVLSVLWSFYWNNRFVFSLRDGEQRKLGKALLKTYISYGFTGIILSNFLSWIWINILDISKYVAPLINLVISVPLNFVINKFWAFKADKSI